MKAVGAMNNPFAPNQERRYCYLDRKLADLQAGQAVSRRYLTPAIAAGRR
jgi:hypothetical protein